MNIIRYKIKEIRIKKAVKNSNYCSGQKEINPNILRLLESENDAMLLVGCIEEYMQDKKDYAFRMRERDGVIGNFFVELYSIFQSSKLLHCFEDFIFNNLAFQTGVELAKNIEEFNIGKFEELCFQNQKKLVSTIVIDFVKNVKNANKELWEEIILKEFDWITYIKYCNSIENADVSKFQNRLIFEGNVFCVVQFAMKVPKADLVEIALFLLDGNKLNEIPDFDIFAGQKVVNRLVERVADSGNLELCKRLKNDINLDEYQESLIEFAMCIIKKDNKKSDIQEVKTNAIEKENEVDMSKEINK